MEKILASCCQHVNGIRFEESTMTKYKTVGPGGRGASFAPPPFQILAIMKQTLFLLKVTFSQKGLMRSSFLQTNELNYFPELEFYFFSF